MAHTVQLSARDKQGIAQQVGARLSAKMAQLPPGSSAFEEIAESFPVWIVDDEIQAAPGAGPKLLLRAYAEDTGSFHHNIVRTINPAPGSGASPSQAVIAAAVSRREPSGHYKVDAVSEPPPGNDVLRWIRNAAFWLEQNAAGDPLVRLLVIPSRYMYCFWLSYADKDCVLPIDMPAKFKHLQYRRIYDSDEFFDLLQQEPEIRGLGG